MLRMCLSRQDLRSAFTLIELLIVIAIISILAMIALPNFLEAQTRAKVSRVVNDFRTIKTGVEAFAVDHGAYPSSLNNVVTPIAYLSNVPQSPFTQEGHYRYLSTGFGGLGVIFYRMASVGPDQQPDFDIGMNEQWIVDNDPRFLATVYDPTNGTTSRGDIIGTNRQIR